MKSLVGENVIVRERKRIGYKKMQHMARGEVAKAKLYEGLNA